MMTDGVIQEHGVEQMDSAAQVEKAQPVQHMKVADHGGTAMTAGIFTQLMESGL